jgi:hypothetical protein
MRVRRNLLLACVLAGFATATRNVGIFLVLPLIYEWIKDGRLEKGQRWRAVYLALAPSGLIIYMGYLWIRFGDPFLFYSAQHDWGRQAAGPLDTALRAWQTALEGVDILRDPHAWTNPSLAELADRFAGADCFYNLIFFIFAVVVLLAGLRELPVSLTICGLLLITPASFFGTPENPLMGIPRYMLIAFPIFITLGLLSKKRLLFVTWLIFSTIVSIVLCALFVSWRFVA